MDKSTLNRKIKPKGAAYCVKPHTSHYYNSSDICVNCGKPKLRGM